MRISAITPTCQRPQALALLRRWVERQTRPPDEWIVVDGSDQPPGRTNFLDNLERGLSEVTGDVVVFLEDDDWLDPAHLARVEALLAVSPDASVLGDPHLRYYHLPSGQWKVMANGGGSALCQTAFRRSALPQFHEALVSCRRTRSYSVDAIFWRSLSGMRVLASLGTVVGMKGLPGSAGLGIGHRPRSGWTLDPTWTKLHEWIGSDVAAYRTFGHSH